MNAVGKMNSMLSRLWSEHYFYLQGCVELKSDRRDRVWGMDAGVNESQKFSFEYIASEGSIKHLSGVWRTLLLNRCVLVCMRNGCPRLMLWNNWSLRAGLFGEVADLLWDRVLLKEAHHCREGLTSLSVFSLYFLFMVKMWSLSFLFWPLAVISHHHDGLLSFGSHKPKLIFDLGHDILSQNRKVTVMRWN